LDTGGNYAPHSQWPPTDMLTTAQSHEQPQQHSVDASQQYARNQPPFKYDDYLYAAAQATDNAYQPGFYSGKHT
jgi:hypothetical protein